MGVLARWDRSNQETLEFQNQDRPPATSARTAFVMWIAVQVAGAVLLRLLGVQLAVAVLAATAIALFAVAGHEYRVRKRAWVVQHR